MSAPRLNDPSHYVCTASHRRFEEWCRLYSFTPRSPDVRHVARWHDAHGVRPRHDDEVTYLSTPNDDEAHEAYRYLLEAQAARNPAT